MTSVTLDKESDHDVSPRALQKTSLQSEDNTSPSTVTTPSDANNDDDDKKVFACPHCPNTFTRKHNLKSHLLIHSQSKPFHCSICSSKFRRLHDLKRHEKLHTGEKPYECEKCGRKFARCDALVRHINSQSGCTLLLDGRNSSTSSSRRNSVNSVQLPSLLKKNYETAQWKINSLPSINKLPLIEKNSQPTHQESSRSKIDIPTQPSTPQPPLSRSQSQSSTPWQQPSVPLQQPLLSSNIDADVLKYIQSLEQRVVMLESKVSQLTYLQSLQFQAQNIQKSLSNPQYQPSPINFQPNTT
ncbi:hypothetical protein WICMUC_004650 [Wickerhamomyces mucosus]|uniref:C2H2-type domain-containing protein n=1 Tax=Wickerhamomyces mucosus TaxID=1378264 RepID=A0A9P8PFJ0_9ASCO|nr:hypothetical protein WICMUC_004650 [Wickerhamomyces mucosus]